MPTVTLPSSTECNFATSTNTTTTVMMTYILTSKRVSQGYMLSIWPARIPATCEPYKATRHTHKGTSYDNSECFRKTSSSETIVTVPSVWASANSQRVLVQCTAVNPLNPELNPICYLLALLAHHFLHVSRIRVKSLTFRLLMSYIWSTHS